MQYERNPLMGFRDLTLTMKPFLIYKNNFDEVQCSPDVTKSSLILGLGWHHKIQTHKNILIFQKKHMDTVSSGGIFKRFCFRYNIV